MFRMSRFMQELIRPTPPEPGCRRAGPVVIWNLTRRCNLACTHCYAASADRGFPGELATEEVYAVMADLRSLRVPALILSGGEPLLRPDILDICRRARGLGLHVSLSTNGTLIDERAADALAAAGCDYVGVSIDGTRETHDRIRRRGGAFDASLRGMRRCRERGIRVGMRVTLIQDNARELPELLALMEDEGIERFYLSHLNYAGRGHANRGQDVDHEATRRVMDLLFDACWKRVREGRRREFVTGNNDADGVYLLLWVRKRVPGMEAHLRARLALWGGNASGVGIASIDNVGNVHPDAFWWHHTLGNVRERPFSEIWQDTSDPILAGLRAAPRRLRGRCGACRYLDVCGGSSRVRAERLTGDPWAEDPACYLTDEEIGAG